MGAGLLQPTHIIFVVVIALLVFGPKRLPEMGRSIGNGIREFKDSMDGTTSPNEHHMETSDHPHGTEPARVADLPPAAAPTATVPPAAAPAASTPAATRSGAPVSR
jgi:sec-independent protein translocase protein TatA